VIHDPAAQSRGWETVLAEAAELTAECGFSPYRGDFRVGKTLSILADPQVDEAGDFMNVLVSCQVLGRRKAYWPGNVVALEEENRRNGPYAFSFLTQRGQARFSGLPLQGYRLSLSPYREEWWSTAARIPPAGLIERQDWIAPESVCAALCERACLTASRKPGEPNDAFEVLLLFSGRLKGRFARPALQAFLGILCNPGFPETLRTSAAGVFTLQSKNLLAEVTLSPFASILATPQSTFESSPKAAGLEVSLFSAFGTLLAARPSFGKDEKGLLAALVARSRSFDTFFAERIYRTRGAVTLREPGLTSAQVRTRGRPKALESRNPLITLAESGGRRVRDVLMELLKEDKRSDRLLLMLKNLKCG
jgi:hypothetical protein